MLFKTRRKKMDINRNNYEPFFLLYVDGELSAADKKAVDAFVQEHTDLQTELRMLQQTVLPPESIGFADKNSLLKIQESVQEQLLLHLDGELDAAQATTLAGQLANDGSLQAEWAILQQTQLDANDTMVFNNKASLYRHEKAPVAAMKWWRLAAAALLIGFGIWGGMALLNGNGTTTGNPGNTPVLAAEVPLDVDSNNDNKALNLPTAPTNSLAVQPTTPSTNEPKANKSSIAVSDKPANSVAPIAPIRNIDPATLTGQNDLERMKKNETRKNLENFNKNEGNEMAVENVSPTNSELKSTVSTPFEKVEAPNETTIDQVLKGNAAVYASNDINATGASNSYLAANSKKVRRSGLLRKVTRFFNRSVNNRGEGDGLKIAGFEFAVR